MSTALTAIPSDDPKRNLTLAQPDEDGTLPHIGLVGDTYTITVTGDDTDGRRGKATLQGYPKSFST